MITVIIYYKKRARIIRCPKCMSVKVGTGRAVSRRRFWRAKLAAPRLNYVSFAGRDGHGTDRLRDSGVATRSIGR